MPPFVSTKCPNCQHRNRLDLAELRKNNANLVKGGDIRSVERRGEEDLEVTCQYCGRKFKFTVKGDGDGKKK